jgi:taurine-pyruvate aminotransferase
MRSRAGLDGERGLRARTHRQCRARPADQDELFRRLRGSIPGARFAERLIDKMPGMSRVYYTNSGSEANEKAFKMVRQIAHKRYGGKKHKILYRDRDYHGSTIGAMSAGGQDERNAQYGPFAPGFVRVPHCLEYRAQWDLAVRNYGEWAADADRGGDPARRPRHRGRALP